MESVYYAMFSCIGWFGPGLVSANFETRTVALCNLRCELGFGIGDSRKSSVRVGEPLAGRRRDTVVLALELCVPRGYWHRNPAWVR